MVVEGGDLIAISERFEVPVEDLRAHNKLASNEVEAGQKVALAATDGGQAGGAGAAPGLAAPAAPGAADGKKPNIPVRHGG